MHYLSIQTCSSTGFEINIYSKRKKSSIIVYTWKTQGFDPIKDYCSHMEDPRIRPS